MVGIISHQGFIFDSTWLPYSVSGAVTQADVGKAVTLDTTAPTTVKLVGAVTDVIIGRLETLEARTTEGITVGTISRRFSEALPFLPGETFTVGSTAVGGAGGLVTVRKVTGTPTPDWSQNIVVQVLTDGTPVVEKI